MSKAIGIKVTPVFVKSLFNTKTNEVRRFTQKIENRSETRFKECFLIDETRRVLAYGSTLLSPNDAHSGKLSSDIALGRAVAALKKKKTLVSERYPVVFYTTEVASDMINVNKQVLDFINAMTLNEKHFIEI